MLRCLSLVFVLLACLAAAPDAQGQVNDKIRDKSNNRGGGGGGGSSSGGAGGGFSGTGGGGGDSFGEEVCSQCCVQMLPLAGDLLVAFGDVFAQYHQEMLDQETSYGPMARITSLEARLPAGLDVGNEVVAFRPRLTGNYGLFFAEARGYLNTELPSAGQASDNLNTWSAQLGLNLVAVEYFNLKVGTGLTDFLFVEGGNQRTYHEVALRADGYYERFRYGAEIRSTPAYANHRNRARDEIGAWAAYQLMQEEPFAVEAGAHFRFQNWFEGVELYYGGLGLWLRWE